MRLSGIQNYAEMKTGFPLRSAVGMMKEGRDEVDLFLRLFMKTMLFIVKITMGYVLAHRIMKEADPVPAEK